MNFEQSLELAGLEILNRIGRKAKFRTGGGLPVPGIVTSRSGALRASIEGGVNSIRKVTKHPNMMIFSIGSRVPYAALLEKGGVRVVSSAMRRFFWAKYFSSEPGDPLHRMWSALRFKNIIKYLPRPYLKPAVDEVASEIPEILRRYTNAALKFEIIESITGDIKAVPLNAIK